MVTVFSTGRAWRALLIAIFSVFFAGAPVGALTLQEAREEALRSNLDIMRSREVTAQAEYQYRESYTKLLPVLSLSGSSYYYSNESAIRTPMGSYGTYPFGPVPLNDVNLIIVDNAVTYTGGVKLQQPIYQGGRLYSTYKEFEAKVAAASWDEQQMKQDILFVVEKGYSNLLKAQDLGKLAERHRNTLTVHLADVEKKYEHGRAAYIDVLKIKVELARAEGDLVKALHDVAIAEGQLNLILNRPLDQSIDAAHIAPPQTVTVSRATAEEIAKSNNKALNAARSKKTTAMYQRKVSEADYYPNINLATEYALQTGQPSQPANWWYAIVSLDWPLWQWGGTNSKVGAAKAYERQMEFTVMSLENLIVDQVRSSFFLIVEADKRMAIDQEAIARSEENLRITQIGFDNGRKTSTDLIDAEDQLSKSRSLYIQDLYDAHIARAQLRYVMGVMETDTSQNGNSSSSPSLRDEKHRTP